MSLKTGEMNERMAFRARNSALSHEIKIISAPGSESKGSLTVKVDHLRFCAIVLVSLIKLVANFSRTIAGQS